MTEGSPKRTKRRWSWVLTGIVLIASMTVWRHWPHHDPGLVGEWQVTSGLKFRFAPDGTCQVEVTGVNNGLYKATMGARWECRGNELYIHMLYRRGFERLKDEIRQLYAKWTGQSWFMFRFRLVEMSADVIAVELVEGKLHGAGGVEPGGRITWRRIVDERSSGTR